MSKKISSKNKNKYSKKNRLKNVKNTKKNTKNRLNRIKKYSSKSEKNPLTDIYKSKKKKELERKKNRDNKRNRELGFLQEEDSEKENQDIFDALNVDEPFEEESNKSEVEPMIRKTQKENSESKKTQEKSDKDIKTDKKKNLLDMFGLNDSSGSLFKEKPDDKLKITRESQKERRKKELFGSDSISDFLKPKKSYKKSSKTPSKKSSKKSSEKSSKKSSEKSSEKSSKKSSEKSSEKFDIKSESDERKIDIKPEQVVLHPLDSKYSQSNKSNGMTDEELDNYNFNFCRKKQTKKDRNRFPYPPSPFYLKDQEEISDTKFKSPGTPDTLPLFKLEDDPGFYYKLDKYLSGKTKYSDCDYTVPDRSLVKGHTCMQRYGDGVKLYRYQKLVSDYLSPETPYRGLLVFHGLGSGKTILSISVLSNFIKRDPDRSIIVITPPGLRQNFESELNLFSPIELFGDKIGNEIEDEIRRKNPNNDPEKAAKLKKELFKTNWKKRIYLASYQVLANRLQKRYANGNLQKNSSLWNEPLLDSCLEKGISPITGKDNRTQGVCRGTTLTPDSKSPCKTLKQDILCNPKDKKFLDTDEFPTLENCLIIIDEAHKLINPSKEERIFAPIILRAIRRAQDLRVLLLTATPVDKEPFELGILLNLLKDKNSKTRFPEVIDKETGLLNLEETKKIFYDEFTKIEHGIRVPANIESFKEKCKGLVSYYNTELDLTKFAERVYEPEQLSMMEGELLKKWRKARNKEIKSLQNANLPLSCGSKDSCDSSRKISDFDSTRTQQIKEFTKELLKHSPKIELAVKNINENFKLGKQFAYSYWDTEGVYALSESLKRDGWVEYDADLLAKDYIKNSGTTRNRSEIRAKGWKPVLKKDIPNKKAFITLGKKTTEKWREAVVKAIFNRKENYLGAEMNLLIVNRKYSEGVSLKNMRACHILEPPESNSLKDQIIGRCVRDCSHLDIPYKDWKVKIYTYYSTINNKTNEIKKEDSNVLQQKIDKEIADIIEQDRLKNLYEGPLKTPKGSLLNEEKVRKCINRYNQCLSEIQEDRESEKYKDLSSKCLGYKNFCITNSKIKNEDDEQGLELDDDFGNKNKYDYLDDVLKYKENKVKEGEVRTLEEIFQENQEDKQLRDNIEDQIKSLSIISSKISNDIEKATEKSESKQDLDTKLDQILGNIDRKSSDQSDIQKAVIRSLEENNPPTPSEEKRNLEEALKKSLEDNTSKNSRSKSDIENSLDRKSENENLQKVLQESVKENVEQIIRRNTPSEEIKKAIEKSKQYNFKKGDICIYSPTGEKVTILQVYNSNPPYYLIKMQNGRERQTVIERLEKITQKDLTSLSGGGREKKTDKGDSDKKTVKKEKKNIKNTKKEAREKIEKRKYIKTKELKEDIKEKIKKDNDKNICEVKDKENPENTCKSIDFCQWEKTPNGNECSEIGTDKSLEILANNRGKVSSGFLKILKETAIDCEVFKNANEKDLKCYRPELPPNYLKDEREKEKKKKHNIELPKSFLQMQQDREIDCSTLQKAACQEEDKKCYYEEPNPFVGVIGKDTGCRNKPLLKDINCNRLSYNEKQCEKEKYLCQWNKQRGLDYGLILKDDACEFRFNEKLRKSKFAIAFSTEENPNYSQESKKVHNFKNVTKKIIENQINENIRNIYKPDLDYKLLEKIIINLTELFYNYPEVRDKMVESVEILKNNEKQNPDLWDHFIKNKFFNLINTRNLTPPPNVPIIMEADIDSQDCKDIDLRHLKSKDKKNIHFVFKINLDDFDYYFRTDEKPYDKKKYYIPVLKTLNDGYYNTNIDYVGFDIFLNFKLKEGHIDKIYLSLKKKEYQEKNKTQPCKNNDNCLNICDDNFNICI
jgi:hypothetical protein